MSWTHRLTGLDLSSSSSLLRMGSIRKNSFALSLFEHRLAKYRSLPFLWFRACTLATPRPIGGNKNTILISFNHFDIQGV
ncbi:unnamed protein product [Rotaria socialis]|uniref:Uncharacterized protein n=1 Tax=Rotaria socialis TaxID=392032 RepID=A0A820ERX5_9BILA|nr:unnamed protein product [Rotaria socialis]CAF4252925.1 unnamed protein product [Rotaria socialis]